MTAWSHPDESNEQKRMLRQTRSYSVPAYESWWQENSLLHEKCLHWRTEDWQQERLVHGDQQRKKW